MPCSAPHKSDLKRIMIVGCGGSGKSTLAKALSERLSLPVLHLDRLYWQPNWQMRDPADFTARVNAAIAEDCWIMDGNYSSTMPQRLARADLVIFLDMAGWRSLWRIWWRTIKHYRRSRPDMPQGCNERFNWEFTRYVWTFNKKKRPSLLALLNTYKGPLKSLRSPKDVKHFLAELKD